jgi:hypothetical protein
MLDPIVSRCGGMGTIASMLTILRLNPRKGVFVRCCWRDEPRCSHGAIL